MNKDHSCDIIQDLLPGRSEERRVGKEFASRLY